MTRTLPIGVTLRQATNRLNKNGVVACHLPRAGQNGFTMMELMLVMAIIAVLSAISMPALKGFGESRRLKASTSNLRNLLTFARDTAITERMPYLVVVDLGSNLYWLASSETFDVRNPLTSVIGAQNSTVMTAQPSGTQRQAGTTNATGQFAISRTSAILGVPQALEQNVTLVTMVTNHNGRTEQIESGIEYVYFSPIGTSEETRIYLRNQQNQMMSIIVESVSGRAYVQQLTDEDIQRLGFEAEERQ